jgi:hypothetical protein
MSQAIITLLNAMLTTQKTIKYIIPKFDVTDQAAFTNQPANDGVEIVSSSASDVGKCTIWGTTNGTTTMVSETVTLTGATPKATTKTDWGTIYAVFLGDSDGKNITPAVGTITVREASADQTICQIAVGKISKGSVIFALPTSTITLDTISGTLYMKTLGVATSSNGKTLTSSKPIELRTSDYIYMGVAASDSTGVVADIIVWGV